MSGHGIWLGTVIQTYRPRRIQSSSLALLDPVVARYGRQPREACVVNRPRPRETSAKSPPGPLAPVLYLPSSP